VTDVSRATALLRERVGVRAYLPGDQTYASALGRVFFPDAARRHPACIVTPGSASEVSSVLQIAQANQSPVTVKGGGLSSTCVADDAIMLDLSLFMDTATRVDGHVVAGGGATMGTLLDNLAPAGLTLPTGIVKLAGLGLATRGGVGFRTRNLGLTMDQLTCIELVLPSGEIRRLSTQATGDDADLWWAVRGCAPNFGVVTSATFRATAARPLFVDQMVVAPEALAAYFDIAPGLPRHTSMSVVLGTRPDVPQEPAMLVYTVCASESDAAIEAARDATSAVATSAGCTPTFRMDWSDPFTHGLPEMGLPFSNGLSPEPVHPAVPSRPSSGFFFGKSVFLDATPGPELAAALVEQLRRAPTPACRIDLQHTGGALADVGDADTAFWGRHAEWNAPVNAIAADEGQRDECVAWARDTIAAFAPHAIGVYGVELRPGFPETEQEVTAAYGGNLPRLSQLARTYDPTGVFDRYAPLSSPAKDHPLRLCDHG
jgi:FAD/FMN-containing dehydrogenase